MTTQTQQGPEINPIYIVTTRPKKLVSHTSLNTPFYDRLR